MTHLTIQQLVAQTDGALTGPSLTLVEKHISECETCWQEMERLAEQDALLASVITVDPGDAFFEDLAASVEAEISGKKKPAPRAAARPAPAAAPVPVAIQRPERVAAAPMPAIPSPEREATYEPPATASPEREATSQPPAIPSPEPEATSQPPAIPSPEPEAAPSEPIPLVNFDAPPADALPRLAVDPVGAWSPPAPGESDDMVIERGGVWTHAAPKTTEPAEVWTPPAPTPDDPFADLVLPPRSAVAPTPKPAPKPAAATPAPKPVAAKPAVRPAPTPARRPLAALPPIRVPAQPQVEPATQQESRRQPLAVPILIGVLAFIAGLAVAVVVVIRLAGPGGILSSRTEPGAPATVRTVNVPPTPAPAASTEPAPAAVDPPVAPPALVVEPRPEISAAAPPVEQAPAPSARTAARPRRHAPPAASSAADNAALNAQPTVVIPVHVIRSETMASASPPAPAPAPAPAPSNELGILCGAVRDSEGHPVARAQVMMADVGVVVLTDRAGRFCLTAPVGERTLSVVALGFTASRRLVSLGKRTPEINLTLQSAAPFPTPR